MTIVLHVASFLAGTFLLAYALLSYEDEERKIRNWLEDTWIVLDDQEKVAGHTLAKLIHRSAAIVTLIFDWIYGRSILSPAALLSSAAICISLTGMVFSMLAGFSLPVNLLLVALLATPFIGNKIISSLGIIQLLMLVMLLGYPSDAVPFRPQNTMVVFGSNVLGLLLALLLDFAYISLTRTAMRKLGERQSVLVSIALSMSGVLICIGGIVGFAVLAAMGGGDVMDDFSWASVGVIAIAFSIAPLLNATLIFVLALLAVTYRIVWLLLPRATYATIKFKLFENRKLITRIAVALIGYAYPPVGEVVKQVLKFIV